MTTETTRTAAIDTLKATIISEDIGHGGYSDSAAYKLVSGDISTDTPGLSPEIVAAIQMVGRDLTWAEIGR